MSLCGAMVNNAWTAPPATNLNADNDAVMRKTMIVTILRLSGINACKKKIEASEQIKLTVLTLAHHGRALPMERRLHLLTRRGLPRYCDVRPLSSLYG